MAVMGGGVTGPVRENARSTTPGPCAMTHETGIVTCVTNDGTNHENYHDIPASAWVPYVPYKKRSKGDENEPGNPSGRRGLQRFGTVAPQ